MTRYHPFLVVLHWLLAAMIIGGLIMGSQVLAATPNSDPFKMTSLLMHMSMGIAILALMIVRLIVRFATAKPPHADIGNPLLNTGAKAAHWAFYVLVIAMCASGLATANAAGLPAIVFGGSGDPLPANFDDIASRAAHGVIAILLGLLILAHVAAGIYHQFVRKDGLFARMWFGQRDA
ncbi:MAG: cytochrome b/b6 domain-containing protein [Paracoccaceae bacterium]|nr:cytochrome b/b6 domain-containing protein [Paracoccaceae bacterium]